MFDIGFSELLLVFVIGLIVLGPQRLPVALKSSVLSVPILGRDLSKASRKQ